MHAWIKSSTRKRILQNPETKTVKTVVICHPFKMASHKKVKKKKKRQPMALRKISQLNLEINR